MAIKIDPKELMDKVSLERGSGALIFLLGAIIAMFFLFFNASGQIDDELYLKSSMISKNNVDLCNFSYDNVVSYDSEYISKRSFLNYRSDKEIIPTTCELEYPKYKVRFMQDLKSYSERLNQEVGR